MFCWDDDDDDDDDNDDDDNSNFNYIVPILSGPLVLLSH